MPRDITLWSSKVLHINYLVAPNPIGNVESVATGDGTVTVGGWAFDYDYPSTSINIHVYIGGAAGSTNAIGYNIGTTNVLRTDVNIAYGLNGNHGFNHTITTSKRGTQSVYIYAINMGAGETKLLAQRTVNIGSSPIGNYESATAGAASVKVIGWAFDHDMPSTAISIHVYIGGPAGSGNATGYNMGATNVMRPDVNRVYGITGTHGFEYTISTSKRGVQPVYVYAINVGAGSTKLIGQKNVNIPTGDPIGCYDGAVGGSGTVRVYGWAFDYDAPSTAIPIHVYIGGPTGSPNGIGYNIGVTSQLRNDVNSVYGITGNHGFDNTITTTKRGTQPVYIYAINAGDGETTLLGQKTVTIN